VNGETTKEFRRVTATDMRVKMIQSANRLLLNFVEQSLRVERPASRQIFG